MFGNPAQSTSLRKGSKVNIVIQTNFPSHVWGNTQYAMNHNYLKNKCIFASLKNKQGAQQTWKNNHFYIKRTDLTKNCSVVTSIIAVAILTCSSG